jgi:short chain dehydrogenase
MKPRYDFTGQVAVVTGGSSGMGLATAQAFAEAGAAVVLADVNEDALHAAVEDLSSSGQRALGVLCDVSKEDQVAAMVAVRWPRLAGWTWRSTTPAFKPHPLTPPMSLPKPSIWSTRSTSAAYGPA